MKKIRPAEVIKRCTECDAFLSVKIPCPVGRRADIIPQDCPLPDYKGWQDKPDSEGFWFSKPIYSVSIFLNDVWKSVEGLKIQEFAEIFSNGHLSVYDDDERISRPTTHSDFKDYKWHKATVPEE